MNIVVCVKYVPDTAIKVKIAPDRKNIELSDVTFVVNPYDEFAVEEALQIKERLGGTVTVISAGSEKATAALRTCLAMGADSGVLIKNDALESADSFTIGIALAQVCKELAPDIILLGKHAIGVDNGQVASVVAEILDLPQASVVVKLEIQDSGFTAHREIEGAHEVIEGRLPAVFTTQKGLNTPRYASLKGIMAAKKKEIQIRTLESLGISSEDVAARVVIEEISLPPPRPPGNILTGDVSETVPQLVRLLHEEAKVI